MHTAYQRPVGPAHSRVLTARVAGWSHDERQCSGPPARAPATTEAGGRSGPDRCGLRGDDRCARRRSAAILARRERRRAHPPRCHGGVWPGLRAQLRAADPRARAGRIRRRGSEDLPRRRASPAPRSGGRARAPRRACGAHADAAARGRAGAREDRVRAAALRPRGAHPRPHRTRGRLRDAALARRGRDPGLRRAGGRRRHGRRLRLPVRATTARPPVVVPFALTLPTILWIAPFVGDDPVRLVAPLS